MKLPDDEFNAFCPSLEQFSIDGKPLNGTAAEDRGMVMKLEVYHRALFKLIFVTHRMSISIKS